MTKHLLSIALLAGLMGAGCQHETRPAPQTPQPLPVSSFAQKWPVQVDPKHGDVRAVFVREELLIAYTSKTNVYVISRDSGQLMQVLSLPGDVKRLHPPVLLKEYLIFPTLNTLEIFDRKTARPVRSIALEFPLRSDVVGSKNFLYLGADFSGGGRAVALDLNQKYAPQKWELMFPNSAVSAAPAYANETVFAAAEDGTVTAVTADQREAAWQLPNGIFKADGSVVADLKADDTGLFVATTQGRLYCLNRTTGRIKWQFFANGPLKKAPVITKSLVYQFVTGGGIVALDRIEGVDKNKPPQFNRQPRWTDSQGAQFLADDEKYSYVRQSDNHIVALDKITGKIAFSSKRNDFVAAASNQKDGTIYAATKWGEVLAIQAVTRPGAVGEIVSVPSPQWLVLARAN